ncbi:MAG: glycine betaine ABC transporter substrate-binding protein [Pseudomonadota bacterium]
MAGGKLGALAILLSLSVTAEAPAAGPAAGPTAGPTAGIVAADPEGCSTVRFATVGWSDIQTTTATATTLLEALGYRTEVETWPVTDVFRALAQDKADVFLGTWLPTMADDVAPYLASGGIDGVRTNLEGARFTLAVPTYLAEQGLRSFDDIADFAEPLGRRVHGIEPGNDGNRLIQAMILDDQFGLGDFRLMEGGERAMVDAVDDAVMAEAPILFLAWEPHPINSTWDITYLEGGDDVFGPAQGAATVHTTVRGGYLEDCPNVGKLLQNLGFTLDYENQVMAMIIDAAIPPERAAADWLTTNPELLESWLDGVRTLDDRDGLLTVMQYLGV